VVEQGFLLMMDIGFEGHAEKRRLPRKAPPNTLLLTLHDHRQLPSYGVINDITEWGASIANDYPLKTGSSVRLKIGFEEPSGAFETEARVVWSRPGFEVPGAVVLGPVHGLEFTGLSENERGELRERLEETDLPGTEGSRHGWRSVALLAVSFLLLIAMGAASMAFYHIRSLNERVATALTHVEQRTRQIDTGLQFDSRRRALVLAIRDEIMQVNYRIELSEAYQYAQFILLASEKYPSVDPLLFVSIGIVESGYDTRATSHASAAGLYQIRPSTGRILARTLNWEYSDEMLYDPEKNTELAALYLDILFSTHDEVEWVLAEYNGGPRNAHYFRAGSNQLADETRSYVPKVMAIYDRLRNRFEAEARRADLTGLPTETGEEPSPHGSLTTSSMETAGARD
jgi:hypothetical protein